MLDLAAQCHCVFYSRRGCKYMRETLAGAVNINLHQGSVRFLRGLLYY